MQTIYYICLCSLCKWYMAVTHYSSLLLSYDLPSGSLEARTEVSSEWIPYHSPQHYSNHSLGMAVVCVCVCFGVVLYGHALYVFVWGAALFMLCIFTMCCSIDSWWPEAGCLLIQASINILRWLMACVCICICVHVCVRFCVCMTETAQMCLDAGMVNCEGGQPPWNTRVILPA